MMMRAHRLSNTLACAQYHVYHAGWKSFKMWKIQFKPAENSPASTKACISAKAVAEVISLGLQTTVLPQASAGASLKLN
jgi:hypothetical protein